MTSRGSTAQIVVVGDVIDDIVAIPQGPIRRDSDTAARIHQRAGGAGANTAAWLGHLGYEVVFVGAVGEGDAARHAALLEAHGVAAALVELPDERTGSIVVIVDGDERTMLTDRGANDHLSAADVRDALLEGAALLHLSGYSVTGAFGLRGTRSLCARAAARGVRISLSSASTGFIDDFGVDDYRSVVADVDVLILNRAEGALLTGQSGDDDIVAALLEWVPVVALTLGRDGVRCAERDGSWVHVPAREAVAVDPTGAGDAFAAAFIGSWLRQGELAVAAAAGSSVAAEAVATIGARPAA